MTKFSAKKIVCLIPPYYDFLCATVIDGLKQLNCRLHCNERTNNATEKEYTPLKELLANCNDCDFIFLFSSADYSSRKRFIIENNLRKKTVYLDGSDNRKLEDPDAFRIFNLCFKRELPFLKFVLKSILDSKHILDPLRKLKRYYLYSRYILSLPFAAEQVYFSNIRENIKKDISVSCTLRPHACNPPERARVIELIRDLNIPNAVIGPINKANYRTDSFDKLKEEYFKVLARSRISVSYPGLGFDTGRFWEILANKALLFSPPIQIKMPQPFLEFKHFIPYSNLSQLKNRLLYYSNNEEERERIADAGYRHLLQYHTSKKRAEYLLEMISQRLNFKRDFRSAAAKL